MHRFCLLHESFILSSLLTSRKRKWKRKKKITHSLSHSIFLINIERKEKTHFLTHSLTHSVTVIFIINERKEKKLIHSLSHSLSFLFSLPFSSVPSSSHSLPLFFFHHRHLSTRLLSLPTSLSSSTNPLSFASNLPLLSFSPFYHYLLPIITFIPSFYTPSLSTSLFITFTSSFSSY